MRRLLVPDGVDPVDARLVDRRLGGAQEVLGREQVLDGRLGPHAEQVVAREPAGRLDHQDPAAVDHAEPQYDRLGLRRRARSNSRRSSSRRVFACTDGGSRSSRPVAGCSTEVGPSTCGNEMRMIRRTPASSAASTRFENQRVFVSGRNFSGRGLKRIPAKWTIDVDALHGRGQRARVGEVGLHELDVRQRRRACPTRAGGGT